MGDSSTDDTNYLMIKNILTLRYNPTKRSLIPKLSWRNFLEKNVSNPTHFIEESMRNTIIKKIGHQTKRISIALSGGIDSALTLAILRDTLTNVNIDAISIRFAGSIDEVDQAAIIAEKFEANHHVVHIENYLKELPKAISIIKLPFWDLHWYHVVKKAKSLSNFLISGDGGDELFGGYTFRYKKFLSLTNEDSTTLEKIKAYLQCHERDWVPDQEKIFSKKITFSWNKIYDFLKPNFDNPLPRLAQVFLADFNGKLLYNWLPLNSAFHRHFEVKPITPILSQELISYTSHLPYNLKYDGQSNIGKLLLRKILAKYLTRKLLATKKQGFSVNTINLWKSYGRELCNYYLSDGRILRQGWINEKWIKSRMSKLDNEPQIRYVNKFLGLLALEIWCRLYVTKEMKPTTLLV